MEKGKLFLPLKTYFTKSHLKAIYNCWKGKNYKWFLLQILNINIFEYYMRKN